MGSNGYLVVARVGHWVVGLGSPGGFLVRNGALVAGPGPGARRFGRLVLTGGKRGGNAPPPRAGAPNFYHRMVGLLVESRWSQ